MFPCVGKTQKSPPELEKKVSLPPVSFSFAFTWNTSLLILLVAKFVKAFPHLHFSVTPAECPTT